MPPAPDRIRLLFEGIRRALTSASARTPPLLEAFGKFQGHAEAIVAMGLIVRELLVHRRTRDRALAAGRLPQAQRAGRRLAECEQVVLGLVELLSQEPGI